VDGRKALLHGDFRIKGYCRDWEGTNHTEGGKWLERGKISGQREDVD